MIPNDLAPKNRAFRKYKKFTKLMTLLHALPTTSG